MLTIFLLTVLALIGTLFFHKLPRRTRKALRKAVRKIPPLPWLRRVGRILRKLFTFLELPVGFATIFGNSAQAQLSYVIESVWGTTPGSPSMLKWRMTDVDLNLGMTKLVSEERRPDGQIPFVRHGMHKPEGTVSSELTYLALKDLLALALRYNPTLVAGKVTGGPTIKFTTGPNQVTRNTGSFVTDGFVAGMQIRVTGAFVTGNNGIWLVTAVTALAMTLSAAPTADATGNATTKINAYYIQNGTYEGSVSAELGLTDIVQYFVHTGLKVDQLTIDAKTDAIPTVQFKLIGKDVTASGSTLGAPTDVDTSVPADPYSTGTGILIGGTAAAIVSTFNLQGQWSRKLAEVLGQNTGAQINVGRFEVSGKCDLFLPDLTQYNIFLNETVTSFLITFADPLGNEFQINLPAVKYTAANRPVKGNDPVMLAVEWEAFLDTVSGTTMQINMIPATAS